MSKHLGGIIGYKDKTSSRHLIGFPDGSNNMHFYFTCVAALSDGRFTLPIVSWKYDSVVCPKKLPPWPFTDAIVASFGE